MSFFLSYISFEYDVFYTSLPLPFRLPANSATGCTIFVQTRLYLYFCYSLYLYDPCVDNETVLLITVLLLGCVLYRLFLHDSNSLIKQVKKNYQNHRIDRHVNDLQMLNNGNKIFKTS